MESYAACPIWQGIQIGRTMVELQLIFFFQGDDAPPEIIDTSINATTEVKEKLAEDLPEPPPNPNEQVV